MYLKQKTEIIILKITLVNKRFDLDFLFLFSLIVTDGYLYSKQGRDKIKIALS